MPKILDFTSKNREEYNKDIPTSSSEVSYLRGWILFTKNQYKKQTLEILQTHWDLEYYHDMILGNITRSAKKYLDSCKPFSPSFPNKLEKSELVSDILYFVLWYKYVFYYFKENEPEMHYLEQIHFDYMLSKALPEYVDSIIQRRILEKWVSIYWSSQPFTAEILSEKNHLSQQLEAHMNNILQSSENDSIHLRNATKECLQGFIESYEYFINPTLPLVKTIPEQELFKMFETIFTEKLQITFQKTI